MDCAAVLSDQNQSLLSATALAFASPEPVAAVAAAEPPAVRAETAPAFLWRLRDGGGVGSDADWGSPREDTDVLSALRVEWLRLIHDWHLVPRLLKAVAERSKEAWLSDEEIHILREVLVSFLKSRGLKCSAVVEPGQPLALELWEGLFSLCGDECPLAFFAPSHLPGCGVSRETDVAERPNVELHTWLKFGDWACDSVKPCAEEKQVAGFFLRLIEPRAPVHLVELEQKAVVAAADACASEHEAGLGGWWLPAGSPLEVDQLRWFSFKVQVSDLLDWFRPQHQNGRVVVRQRCDNLGVVGAAAKGFSMKEPVAAVLQAAAVFCMRERINLRVSHVAGARNEWADMLSRGAAAYPEFWQRLSMQSRRSLDWRETRESN
ncbi:unnamed protein product [Symbiodinium sp. CCMP2592]|nr:unnamed protein product [Symbiodinium sp. CCMP2592]